MTTQEAVQLWGGHTGLAKVLGITRDAIISGANIHRTRRNTNSWFCRAVVYR